MTDRTAVPEVEGTDAALNHIAAWSIGLADDLPDPTEFDPVRLAGLASTHRVLGVLLTAVDAGGLQLPEPVVDQIVDGHRDAMAWCLKIERRVLDLHRWFADAGIRRWLVLKGPACAHLDEADPAMRAFADLDLLVADDDIDAAIAILQHHGATRRLPERRPGFDRRFERSVGMHCPDLVEIDLHRTLAVGGLGFRIPLDDLFAEADTFDLGGRTIRGLSRRHRALHATYHAVLGTTIPDLRTARDLAAHLGATESRPETLIGEAQRWGGETVLHQAVAAILQMLPIDLPRWRTWITETSPDTTDLRLIQATRRPSRTPHDRGILTELGGLDRLRYLWAVAVPSRAVLANRQQNHLQRLTDGLRRSIQRRSN